MAEQPDSTTKKPVIHVRKLGMSVKPAFLLMIYREARGKYRERKMPVRDFTVTSNVTRTARALKARHKPYMDKIPTVRIEKLLRMIQECRKAEAAGEKMNMVAVRAAIEEEYSVDGSKDLNKVSSEELQRQKDIMEESFQKSAVTPDDSGYVYDKRVDFEEETKKKNSEWDSDDEEEQEKARDSGCKGDSDERGKEEEDEVQEEIETAQDGEEVKNEDASEDDW